MHRVQFKPLDPSIARAFGHDVRSVPVIAWMGYEAAPRSRGKRSHIIDRQRCRVLGMGGLMWREGLCWLWLDDIDMPRTSAIKVMKSAIDMLAKAAQLGETRIFAARDPAPRSEKLLLLLGFGRLDDDPRFMGREVWARTLTG